jgi:ferredoxin
MFRISGTRNGKSKAAVETASGLKPAIQTGGIMQKSLHIDPNKCTGCLQCEMACSFENHGVFNISKSRIKVFNFEHAGRKVPYTCTQCAEAWCLNACPVDAIRVDAGTGAKVVHRGRLRRLQGVHHRLPVWHGELRG